MNEFTIWCTPEQTRKAFELGAPIEINDFFDSCDIKETNIFYKDKFIELSDGRLLERITAEQMCNWLRKEKNIFFVPKKVGDNNYVLIGDLKYYSTFDTYEEAILAGIDAALEYLSNNKK